MPEKDILTRYAILKTTEKLPDKFLFSGRFFDEQDSSDSLFYLFEIRSPYAASAKVKKSVLDCISKDFFNHSDLDESFENLIQKINESLNSLSKKGENCWVGNINAVVGLISGGTISIAQTGKTTGYIFRKGRISSLIENSHLTLEPHPIKTFTDITSGRLAKDDRIVFSNTELYNHLSLDRIRRTVEELSAKEALAEIFKNLKRSRVIDVNVIFVEALSNKDEASQLEMNLPDTISLADSEENAVHKIKKACLPVVKSAYRHSKKYGIATFHFTKKHLTNFKEKYTPEAKKLLNKSGKAAGNAFSQAKTSFEPTLSKIKDKKNYPNIKVKTFIRKEGFSVASSKTIKNILLVISPLKFFILKENRKYLYSVLILIFVLFGYLKIRANNSTVSRQKEEQQITLSYDKAKELFDKTKEDNALGRTSSTDSFVEALALAKKAEESEATKDKAKELSKQIQTSIDAITKTTRLFSPEASITFPNRMTRIILVGQSVYGIDQEEGKIYLGSSGDKSPRLVASFGKKEITSASYSSSKDKILILSGNSISSFSPTSKAIEELKVTDGAWEKSVGISNFVTNVYLLDREQGQIWKHTEGTDGYSKGSAYTNSKNTHLKSAVDIAVDGNVYVLSSDGKVNKFSRGVMDQAFSIKNIPAPQNTIEEPKKIYTDEDVNYIFILDKKLNRVLRFDKAGEFISQYAIDGMGIDDFAVNGKVGKAWLLSDKNVYEIDL